MQSVMKYVIGFSFLSVLLFFFVIFTHTLISEEVLDKTVIIGTNISTELGLSGGISSYIGDAKNRYDAINFPFDLLFLFTWISMFITTLYTSIKSKSQGWFSFMGTITLGFIVFAFTLTFIEIVTDWFIINLFENFLEFNLATTPIFHFYVNNLVIINIIWVAIMILLNRFEFLNYNKSDKNDINIPGGNYNN